MFLKVFLSFLICFFLPTWVFASSCEGGFEAGKVFISFMKKQKGEEAFEKEMDADWSDKITKNTQHWTRAEASQFLAFLIDRRGELSAVRFLKSLANFPAIISFKDLMNKVNFYDQLNKEIVDTLLDGGFFDFFVMNNTVNEIQIQQMGELIESYIGAIGTSAIMRELTLYRASVMRNSGEVYDLDPIEMRKVIHYIEDYIRRHGVFKGTSENRLDSFKEFVSLSPEQHLDRQEDRGIFRNFDELQEFSRWTFEERRKIDKETNSDDPSSALKGMYFILLEQKVTEVFFGFSRAKLHNLKKTVRILEEYIEPSAIAELMLQTQEIYLANPRRLKLVINTFRKAYVASFDTSLLKKVGEVRNITILEPDSTPTVNQFLAKHTVLPKISFKELIVSVINGKYIGPLSFAYPIYLKNIITILDTYLGEYFVPIMLQHRGVQHEKFLSDLLEAAKSSHLQEVIAFLEKNFEAEEITHLLLERYFETTHLFPKSWIVDSDSFIKVVEMFQMFVHDRSVLLQRVNELLQVDDGYTFFVGFYNILVGMYKRLDRAQMTELLTNSPITELSPEAQARKSLMQDMMSAGSSKPSIYPVEPADPSD